VETIRFASALEAKLTYALACDSHASAASLHYLPQEVTVLFTEEQAQAWGQDSQVGVYTTVDLAPEGLLELIVEKDFACLDRSDENNTDHLSESSGQDPLMQHNIWRAHLLQPDRQAARQSHRQRCLHSHRRSRLQRI
jgi:hypothetical protein